MILLLAILTIAFFNFTMVFSLATINCMIDNSEFSLRGVIVSTVFGAIFMALLLIFIANV